jgi:hypothetical protein
LLAVRFASQDDRLLGRASSMPDQLRFLFALAAATCIHVSALSQGFGFASIVTGDIHSQLRPLIVAKP